MRWELRKQNLELTPNDERIRKLVESFSEAPQYLSSRKPEKEDVPVRQDKDKRTFLFLYDKLLYALLKAQELEMFISLFNEIKESIHSSLFMRWRL
jgi:hypothetical protein